MVTDKMTTKGSARYLVAQPLGLKIQDVEKVSWAIESAGSIGASVVVVEVFEDARVSSKQSDWTVQPGDFVTHVGRTRVKGGVDEFVNLLQALKTGASSSKKISIRYERANSLAKRARTTLVEKPKATQTPKSDRKGKRRAKTPLKRNGINSQRKKAPVKKKTPVKKATPTRHRSTSKSAKSGSTKKSKATSSGNVSTKKAKRSTSKRPKSKNGTASPFGRNGTRVPDQGPQSEIRLHNEIPLFIALTTYFGYAILTVFGKLRDFFGKCFGCGRYFAEEIDRDRAPLVSSWENFYVRRMQTRIKDVFSRPITGAPAASGMTMLVRDSEDGNRTMKLTGETREVINLGSYNYLGFADDWNDTCRDEVVSAFDDFGVSLCSSPMDGGTTVIHAELENLVSKFLNKEACCVFNMGYGTNASTIPALVGKGSLIVSDSLNHSSIVNGARASGAKVRVFKHDNPEHLDTVLRDAIISGQPRTKRPWRKILVVCEGIYSMEGEICHLKEIVDVCKKYKCYVYVDEAHSIGALGATGRGITEKCGVDPADIDVLMGTFTKSFGGMGGYIAGSKKLIDFIRATSTGTMYSNAMSPIVCKQILRALQVIMGLDGTNIGKQKLDDLRNNSNYFRSRLIKMGLQVLGDADSPVMPILLYNPTKIAAFSRECLKRGLAVVTVGFPATPLIESRARFCLSAGHTKENLDYALEQIGEVADILQLRYDASWMG